MIVKILDTIINVFFALAGAGVLIFAGYWWGVDRPGWSFPIGLCPVCIHLGVGPGAGVRLAALQAAEAKATQRSTIVANGAVAITSKASDTETKTQIKIQTIYRDIIKEVPNVITPEIDRSFPLSIGFVRLHNAAANGLNVPFVPNTSGQLNDSASSVKSSDAATIIASNYQKCTSDAAQLDALQQWIKSQQANFNHP